MDGSNALPPTPPGTPVIGHTAAFASDPFGFVEQAVDSTGDVFRMRLLGNDVYVVAHPEYVQSALLDRDAFAKLDDFTVAFGDALLSVSGTQWQRQRHAMEQFFSPMRIGEYAETMTTVARRRVDSWDESEPIAIDEAMRTVALENLFEVVLGQSLSGPELESLTESAHALNYWFKPTSWVLPDWVPTPARRKFRRGSNELRDRAQTLLAAAGADPREDSLLATLAALRDDPDSAFDQAEVLDQVVGMLFAGHETTALAMTYALHQLGAHPQVADRCYRELDQVVDRQPTLSQLQELTYLEQVINETLRLFPPVHAIPRETTERVTLGEHTIPAGREVLLSVWNIHRDDRFYDEPLKFNPSRWAGVTAGTKDAFVPFGAGPRICIGRHFARLELKVVMAVICQRYRVEALGDVEVSPQMTSQPASQVRVQLEPRR